MQQTWDSILAEEKSQPYFIDMMNKIEQQRAQGITIYPGNNDIFNAFTLTELNNVKVVILGQDPYHGAEQAHGLAFSVLPNIKVPPSLVNIYKELATDIEGFTIPDHGYLQSWAEQGVLLLNTVLTVQAGNAHSHAKLGWEKFTDAVIEKLNASENNIVFLLWGKHAHKKGKAIDQDKHLVLETVHPSPLSAYRGFLGCKHFSTANKWLIEKNKEPINWTL